jgi:hypothetical protein
MGGMEKTTVYLSAAQKDALARTAQAEGRSEATLIRTGIDIVTARHRVGEAAVPFVATDQQTETANRESSRRPRWVPRAAFVKDFIGRQADAALRTELDELAPDATDGLPIG